MVDIDRPDIQNILYSIASSNINFGMQQFLQQKMSTSVHYLDTTTAIIYDSVHAFALALHQLRSVQQVHQMNLDCSGLLSWHSGNSITNYMKVKHIHIAHVIDIKIHILDG